MQRTAAVRGRRTGVRRAERPAEDRQGLAELQSTVGNRAVAGLLSPLRRVPEDGTAVLEGPANGGGTSGGGAAIAGGLLSMLAGGISYLAGVAAGNPSLLRPLLALEGVTDNLRLQLIESLLEQPLDETAKATMRQVWSSFGLDRLPRVIADHSTLWDRCNAAGAELPASWIGAGAGKVETNAQEQVGANVYMVHGAYAYRVTSDALTVNVSMDFHPDPGVSVPTATWFGYIASTWNRYDAVNLDDPTQRKRVDFEPVQGAGHPIQVSAGTGRANAVHYYVGDDRAPQTIPHEFGHLIGLEDEYERDAADYERITGTTVPQEDGEGDGESCATQLHDAITLGRDDDETEAAIVTRRRQAVQDVLTDFHVVANYQGGVSAFTHEVAASYKEKYGHEISRDIMGSICYHDTAETADLRDWRERVAGTFQYTDDSIMGDMSDHSHPVEPRHIRGFLGPLARVYGGRWQPVLRG